MNARSPHAGSIALLVIATLTGAVSQAAPQYTEKNPKYGQSARPHPAESIKTLEASVVDTFRKMYPMRSGKEVQAFIVVNDNELLATPEASALRNKVKPNDISGDLTRMLRKAGFEVVGTNPPDQPHVIVEVELGTRSVEVHGISAVTTEWLPDLRATAKTSWNGRVLGQANSLEFLGNDARAWRAFARIGTQDLVRALGIMMLHDFSANNAIPATLNARESFNQATFKISDKDYNGEKPSPRTSNPPRSVQVPPQPAPSPGPTPGQVSSQTPATPAEPPSVGGAALLAQTDRDKALRQILSALNINKS